MMATLETLEMMEWSSLCVKYCHIKIYDVNTSKGHVDQWLFTVLYILCTCEHTHRNKSLVAMWIYPWIRLYTQVICPVASSLSCEETTHCLVLLIFVLARNFFSKNYAWEHALPWCHIHLSLQILAFFWRRCWHTHSKM